MKGYYEQNLNSKYFSILLALFVLGGLLIVQVAILMSMQQHNLL